MQSTRRSFIGGTIAAVGAAFLPTALCAAEDDWKAAFRSLGFDPDAETLWVKYEGFGFGGDECHAAYAFLS